ncbi:MAG: hypothetical protein IT373_03370 [Polyangiaceae bacterium]|nr:hypothetical protein [Polyangiaceae bacterium]
MQIPAETTATQTLLDRYGEHLAATLGADKGTAAQATEFEAAQGALRVSLEARLAAERAQQRAEALADSAEVELERLIRQAELAVLGASQKKRDQEPYPSVLPAGLSGALAPRGKAQAAEARRIATALGSAPAVTPAAASFAPGLVELADKLELATKTVEAAQAAVDAAEALEKQNKRAWRQTYRKIFGSLTALYPDDRRKVEAFFRKGDKKDKAPRDDAGGPRPVA